LPVLLALVVCGVFARAQDSVDVIFRYTKAGATGVTLVGEFNGWNNTSTPMNSQGDGLWTRTVRLPIGINPNADPVKGIPGAWQYKFWYNGVSDWPNDPLNHHQNPLDNNNTYLFVKNPTIYHFLPNQRSLIVTTPAPLISAYLYPKIGTPVDTTTIRLLIDGGAVTGTGGYDRMTMQYQFTPADPLVNGDHEAILQAGDNADTVHFIIQAGFAQITTRGGYATYDPYKSLRGVVQDTSVHTARLVRNGSDTTSVSVVGGLWSARDTLSEGTNSFVLVVDTTGGRVVSSPVVITRIVSHAPVAAASAVLNGGSVTLSAAGSTDPDGAPPGIFYWRDDPEYALGLNGKTGTTAVVPVPATPGEYYYGLIAVDAQGNADTTRSYFVVNNDGSVTNPGYADNPVWARKARVYFLFPKAASPEGNLTGAKQRLSSIRDLGFNVIWMMPVMKNASPINMGSGPGYNITDFYNVAPEYGTNQDMKDFIQEAHAYGIKVILDITPNHSSRSHPWAIDARTIGQDSRYWTWYEHSLIPHNTNNLGQSLDAYGFAYYTGFSDQLLDLNWNELDLRMEMIRIFKYWLLDFGVDGFRFDVYWGPHRRYGESAMGFPVRLALKHVKPDILLLAEDDGTGNGTETIYADYEDLGIRGGVDAAYDFRLYSNQIRGFSFVEGSITNLHNDILNGGYYPGSHALYMRFMESQDEDRIVYFYGANSTIDAQTTFRKTMPIASVIFTAPGFPMLWNGQEVGFGYGIQGSKEARDRSTIDWNYQGRPLLAPHYQKLATLRGAFPAFTAHKQDTNGDGTVNASDDPDFVRVTSSNPLLYAFTRPYRDQNGLTVVNVSGADQTATLDLRTTGVLRFNEDVKNQDPVFANELLSSATQTLTLPALTSFQVTLPAYGSAVYTISLTRDTLKVLNPLLSVEEQTDRPIEFGLMQNYPNPFNPVTTIGFRVAGIGLQNPGPGSQDPGSNTRNPEPATRNVKLSVYDLLGREVAMLVNEGKAPGTYTAEFDAHRLASGVYLYRLTVSGNGIQFVDTKKMIVVK
jgi:glycosidase